MKKTQWIDLWTTIRRNRIPYLAIVIFVALGIALYAGMSWSHTYIDTAMSRTCEEERLAQVKVVYPYGISDEQMDELLQLDGVDDVEGYNSIYRFFDQDGIPQLAAIYQLTERISAPTVVAGTLPVKENEIAVLSSWAEDNGVALGDTITFQEDYGSDYRETRPVTAIAAWDPESGETPDTDTSDPGYLKTNTFTVTALVESPEYITTMKSGYGSNLMNGDQVDAVTFVSEAAMDPALFNGYTSAAIYSESLAAQNDGSDAYDAAYKELEAAVTELTATWTDVPDNYNDVLARFGQLLKDAAQQISDALAQIEEKQTELDKGQQEVTDGENTLAEKQQEYDDGLAQYQAGLANANYSYYLLQGAWNTYDCIQEDIDAATDLMNCIAAFRAVMAEDDDPTPSDTQPSEDQPSSGEDQPSGGDQQSRDEERQAAADAVRASASRLIGLVNSQSDMFADLQERYGVTVDTSGLSAMAAKVLNSSTPEELLAALDEAEAMYGGTIPSLQGLQQLLYNKLAAASDELDAAYAKLYAAADQLSDGLRQLEEGRAKLDDAIAQLAEGREALSKARTEFAEKQAEYENAQKMYQQMDTAAETVYEISPAVFTRASNISLITANAVGAVLLNARTTLASLFLLVAVLVGYSTLARMVADTSLQIGTKKALGFSRWEILRLYLLYAFSAALIGALLGTAGAVGVEAVFENTFLNMYQVEELPTIIQPLPVLLPFLAELLLLSVVVVMAALRQLNRKAIDLLKGTAETEAPKHQPSRLKLSRHMPLLDRIIFTNLRQDRRRVIAMLIGIGGSAMLVTAGLTCLINMSRSIGVQYDRYYKFDTIIRYDPTKETAASDLQALLDSYDVPSSQIYYTHMITTDNNGSTRLPDTFVPVDMDEFSQVMRFDSTDEKPTDYTGGLWVSDSYLSKQGFQIGEVIQLKSLTGDTAELPISGFYKNYLTSLTLVIDMETWRSVYPQTQPNAYLVNLEGIDTDRLQAELNELDGYICSLPYRTNSETAFNAILSIIAAIAAIFSVMAVLLLVMLLINLLDMYIAEKKRELIILKINGYPGKKVRQYIWKDTLILTIVGIILGIVLGTVEGNFTQSSLEGADMLMVHGISWIACAGAAGITGLLALVITLAELKKVDKFHLSDINN